MAAGDASAGPARTGRRRGGAPPRTLRAKARVDRVISNMPGRAALPRRNGELVFDAPWESRAFGLAVALHEARAFRWEEFQRRLIDEIAAWEREPGGEASSWNYYEHWLRSFERLLVEKGICTEDELRAMMNEAAAEDDHRHG